jgi:hypothetical protein
LASCCVGRHTTAPDVKTWLSFPSWRDTPHLQDAVARQREMMRLVEHQVAKPRAERMACHRMASVHQDGPRPAPGPRLAHDALQPVGAAGVIKRRVL